MQYLTELEVSQVIQCQERVLVSAFFVWWRIHLRVLFNAKAITLEDKGGTI